MNKHHINMADLKWQFVLCLVLVFFFGSLAMISHAYSEDLFIIANKSVPIETISSVELKNIYTGKIKLWENGDKIAIAYSKQKSTQTIFLKTYIKKTPQQFVNYWRNLIFTGKSSTIPKGIKDEKELLKYVSGRKGAIGFISSQQLIDDVKTITVK